MMRSARVTAVVGLMGVAACSRHVGATGEAESTTGGESGSTGSPCGDAHEGDELGETCDDANQIDNDGCDADCVPSRVADLSDPGPACVITRTGDVRCWGFSLVAGRMENVGDDEPASEARAWSFGDDVAQVARDTVQACVRFADGDVRCWGRGVGAYVLGYGSMADVVDPTAAGNLQLGGPTQHIALADDFKCALLQDGDVVCWGSCPCDGNFCVSAGYCLGYATSEPIGDDEVPSAWGSVDLGAKATDVAVGRTHACAILANGELLCWGYCIDYTWDPGMPTGRCLGYQDTEVVGDDETPAEYGKTINFSTPVTQVALGGDHTCVLSGPGEVRCWGFGGATLGAGHTAELGYLQSPGELPAVELGGAAVAIAAAGPVSCAILKGGDVRCWGVGPLGVPGFGVIGDDEVPGAVPPVEIGGPATALSVGGQGTACALREDGAVFCWGSSMNGELGYGQPEIIGDDETPLEAGPVPVF